MLSLNGRRPTKKEAEEIIQFERVDPEHVYEWTQAAFPAETGENLAKRDAASKKRAAQRETSRAGNTRILMRRQHEAEVVQNGEKVPGGTSATSRHCVERGEIGRAELFQSVQDVL